MRDRTNAPVVLITGALGLVGSAAAKRFLAEGYHVVGVDNDSRKTFFGDEGSTMEVLDDFIDQKGFSFYRSDLRNVSAIQDIFNDHGRNTVAVIHTASLPAHETCDLNPRLAFDVNVAGTVNILEAMRAYGSSATLIFTSSSKVWGCRHNALPYLEHPLRYDLPPEHPYYNGIPEKYNNDHDERSFLGTTKLAADVLCQEYAYKFGIPTTIFRPVCLTGPNHKGTEAHGFLSYLTRCAIMEKPYVVYGYKGKQVRCNWHVKDMVNAFSLVIRDPSPLQIFNVGGSRHSNCSTLEAIEVINEHIGRRMKWEYRDTPRTADHLWAVGSSEAFLARYPTYQWKYGTEDIIRELLDAWQYRKTHG